MRFHHFAVVTIHIRMRDRHVAIAIDALDPRPMIGSVRSTPVKALHMQHIARASALDGIAYGFAHSSGTSYVIVAVRIAATGMRATTR